MTFLVYYNDDYDSKGIEIFDLKEKAVKFIEGRMQHAYFNGLENYRMFEVIKECRLEPVEKVLSVKAV